MPCAENCVCDRVHDEASLFSIQGAQVDCICRIAGISMGHRQVHKMLAIGKKNRPTMTVMLGCIDFCDLRRYPAGCRNLVNWSLEAGRKNDDPLLVPGTASALGSFAQNRCRAAANINHLQLAIGKEAKETPVRRPEGERRTLCSRERPGTIRIQLTDP